MNITPIQAVFLSMIIIFSIAILVIFHVIMYKTIMMIAQKGLNNDSIQRDK